MLLMVADLLIVSVTYSIYVVLDKGFIFDFRRCRRRLAGV